MKGIKIEQLFKVLACKRRLNILKALKEGSSCICELKPKFKIDITTLSRHIKQLEISGLIKVKKVGTKKYLSLSTPKILDLIDLAEELSERLEE